MHAASPAGVSSESLLGYPGEPICRYRRRTGRTSLESPQTVSLSVLPMNLPRATCEHREAPSVLLRGVLSDTTSLPFALLASKEPLLGASVRHHQDRSSEALYT